MTHQPAPASTSTRQEVLDRVRALLPNFRARAEAAEEARRLPAESAQDLLSAGVARILVPTAFGGYGLGLDTWFDVARAIGKADASHGWCASLIAHHPHLIGMFSAEAQREIWARGPDVAIAASIHPNAQATREKDGYRISGQNSASASGVGHSTWALLGAPVQDDAASGSMLFLIPREEYAVRDTWFTTGMRGTGSNTIVTDNVFVPDTRTLRVSDLRDGTGPGGAINASPIFRAPFYAYSPLTFVAPMLGAAEGAYEVFRERTRSRKPLAERTSIQVGVARAAADLDAAELLVRRAAMAPYAPEGMSPPLLARSVRDFTRAAELVVLAIDSLIAMGGMAGFATSSPIQRAWRDIHFASMHIGINSEINYAHFGRTEFGLPRDENHPLL